MGHETTHARRVSLPWWRRLFTPHPLAKVDQEAQERAVNQLHQYEQTAREIETRVVLAKRMGRDG